MSLNIKNERVHQLARELALKRNSTMTAVILDALERELERDQAHSDEVQMMRIKAREEFLAHLDTMKELPDGYTSDHDDLYDRDGFPA
ncbi:MULTISPECIES: type II toxin-antitoxin system VapB family antitoxin [unclassified Roseitalea]|uniref:type II toxin-antitoxin system VapB family antitoxin n=1 Tax=unclassified Roseitalea TaxID=2639107 RepID=UPI00273F2BC4|nr:MULTISPECIES: type II toxin-antitoxin system VapB family antitoxin [unclassified Roseitalea]